MAVYLGNGGPRSCTCNTLQCARLLSHSEPAPHHRRVLHAGSPGIYDMRTRVHTAIALDEKSQA